MYYPKNKILENQYTRGREFIIKDNKEEYSGYYYALSNGKFYTGKTPNQLSSYELIKSKEGLAQIQSSVITSDFTLPIPSYPQPTEQDYKKGYFTRYFIKRRNADFTTIKEISKKDYELFNNGNDINTNLYVTISLNWKITGPLHDDFSDKNFPKAGIIDTNKKLVALKEKIFPGFSNFFKDYTQYSR